MSNTGCYSMKVIGNESDCSEFYTILNGDHPERKAYEELRDFQWYFEYEEDGFCLYIDGYNPVIASVGFGWEKDSCACSILIEESANLNLDIEVFSVSQCIQMAEHLYISKGIVTQWKLAGFYGSKLPPDITTYPYNWEICDPSKLMKIESTLSK